MQKELVLLLKESLLYRNNSRDGVYRKCVFMVLCFGFASFAEVAGSAVFFFACVPADFHYFGWGFDFQ
jgi:hypothetical protein